MKYQDPRLRDVLAGEYALGTLRGPARRRFERLIAEDEALRRLSHDWELKLNPLAQALPAVAPPPRVWREIEARISGPAPAPRGWWNRLAFWRGASLLATGLALVLALYVGLRPSPELAPFTVALLSGAKGEPAWVVSLVAERGVTREIRVKAVQPGGKAPDQSFELWLIPQAGAAPVSLGLLPEAGSATLQLPEKAVQALPGAAAMAVSLEPRGGSPTGRPTGPVLYQGVLVAT